MKVKIKKLKINKIVRTVTIAVIVFAIGVLSVLLYREVKVHKTSEEKVKLYSYINKSSVDYKVILKPNSIYSTAILGEGKYYITNYVDNIQADFNYEFKGDRSSAIKGSYEVAAVVEGYVLEEKKLISIWEKRYTLSPVTEISCNDKTLTLTKSVNIKLSEYNDFVAVIAEESEVQTPVRLNVYMNVDLKADTDKGPVEAKMTPIISIPLDERYFLITESEAKEEPGSIEETRKVQLPPSKQKVILYECGLCILVIIALGLMIFTEPLRKSLFIIKLNKILKQHGSRLVALSCGPLTASLDNCSIVRSIDDLVRVADELGRPIMYEYNEDYKDMAHFYVLDDKRTYLYILRDSMLESNAVINDEKKAVL